MEGTQLWVLLRLLPADKKADPVATAPKYAAPKSTAPPAIIPACGFISKRASTEASSVGAGLAAGCAGAFTVGGSPPDTPPGFGLARSPESLPRTRRSWVACAC